MSGESNSPTLFIHFGLEKPINLRFGANFRGIVAKVAIFKISDALALGVGHTTQNLEGALRVPCLHKLVKFRHLVSDVSAILDLKERVPVVLSPGRLTRVSQVVSPARLSTNNRQLSVTEEVSH